MLCTWNRVLSEGREAELAGEGPERMLKACDRLLFDGADPAVGIELPLPAKQRKGKVEERRKMPCRKAEMRSTEASAEEAVSKLDPDDLEKVSGGLWRSECKKTYDMFENCWGTDLCDVPVEDY